MKVGVVELGGTHVTGAIVEGASVVRSERLPLRPDAGREELVETILRAAAVARGVSLVAVAAPGPFDYDAGICLIAGLGKLDALYGVELRTPLATALGVEPACVRFLNDAEAFALGEGRYGAARGYRRAIAITLGSGLGCAFLVDGAIVREGVGVPPGGVFHPLAFAGAPVEERISRRGILAAYGDPDVDVAEIADRARAGDEKARGTFARFGDDLAAFLEPWAQAFGAERIVVGGAIAGAWDLFAQPLALLGGVRSVLGADAGLVGVAETCKAV